MIWRGLDTGCMTAWEAFQLLDGELGSGDDPIIYRGEDTTPMDLGYKISSTPAELVRFSYYGGEPGECKLVRGGTLKRMVENRIALRESRTSEPFHEFTIQQLRRRVESRFWPLLTKIRGAGRTDLARIDKALGEIT